MLTRAGSAHLTSAGFLDTKAVLLLPSNCKLGGSWDSRFSPARSVKHVPGA